MNPLDVLHEERVRCFGSNRQSSRRLSLFRKKHGGLLVLTSDKLYLVNDTKSERPSSSQASSVTDGKVLGNPRDITLCKLTNQRAKLWTVAFLDDSGKKKRYQFQSDSVQQANHWVDLLTSLAHAKPVVVVVGSAGVGKSMLCSALAGLSYGNNTFPIGDDLESVTTETVCHTAQWFQDPDEDSFVAVDTPGLGDAHGRDNQSIAHMISSLREIGMVNSIAIVLNAQSPRLDLSVKEMLRVFEQLFGADLWSHACIVFTRWDASPRAETKRKRGIMKNKGGITHEWNAALRQEFPSFAKAFPSTNRQLPCYFVDLDTVVPDDDVLEALDNRSAVDAKLHGERRGSSNQSASHNPNIIDDDQGNNNQVEGDAKPAGRPIALSPQQLATQEELRRFSVLARSMPPFNVTTVSLPSASGGRSPPIGSLRGGTSSNNPAFRGGNASDESDLALFLQRLGLDQHLDNLSLEGITTAEELQLVPNQFLEEIGFDESEIQLIKPTRGGPKVWKAHEDTHARLTGELRAAGISFSSLVHSEQLTLGDMLRVPYEDLSVYFPRVKDRIAFIQRRQEIMKGRQITPDCPIWQGAIVERGADWSYDNPDSGVAPQDGGGAGSPGRVLGWHHMNGEQVGGVHCPEEAGWIRVRWLTTKAVRTYRFGVDGFHDLCFLQSPLQYNILDPLVQETMVGVTIGHPHGGRGQFLPPPPSIHTPIRPRHLRRSFGYKVGHKYPFWTTLDIRDEVCKRVGGFTHGQVIRLKQDGSKHTCVGVGVENGKPELYFHPKSIHSLGAGTISGFGPENFTVIGEEPVEEVPRDAVNFHFDDEVDNDAVASVKKKLVPDFPHLCGNRFARTAMFDIRDEVCSAFGWTSGTTFKSKETGVVIWVVGVKLDDEGVPKLYFQVEGVEGAIAGQSFYVRLSEYEKLPDPTPLKRSAVPLVARLSREELLALPVNPTYEFPRGVGRLTEDKLFDVSDEICLKICGYTSGTMLMGPDNQRITVVGVAKDPESGLPCPWFHLQNHFGAGQIAEFANLQHHFQVLPDRMELDDLKREIMVQRNRAVSNPAAMVLLNLLRQQFTDGTMGSQLQSGTLQRPNQQEQQRQLFSEDHPFMEVLGEEEEEEE